MDHLVTGRACLAPRSADSTDLEEMTVWAPPTTLWEVVTDQVDDERLRTQRSR